MGSSVATTMADDSWLELTLDVDTESWVREHLPASAGAVVPEPHITLLFGCSPDHRKYDGLFDGDLSFEMRRVRPGDISPVLLCGVESEGLQTLFWRLYHDPEINVGQKHSLIDGKYDPHVTLAYLSDQLKKSSPEVRAATGLAFDRPVKPTAVVLQPEGRVLREFS